MPPKKHTGSETQESSNMEAAQEVSGAEAELRNQILELRRKLTISNTEKERCFQECVQQKNILIREYQDQISKLTNEKDDEIRNLTRANELGRWLRAHRCPKGVTRSLCRVKCYLTERGHGRAL